MIDASLESVELFLKEGPRLPVGDKTGFCFDTNRKIIEITDLGLTYADDFDGRHTLSFSLYRPDPYRR